MTIESEESKEVTEIKRASAIFRSQIERTAVYVASAWADGMYGAHLSCTMACQILACHLIEHNLTKSLENGNLKTAHKDWVELINEMARKGLEDYQ